MSNKAVTDFTAEKDKALIDRVKSRSAVPVGGAPMPTIPRLDQAPPNPAVKARNAESAKRLITPDESQRLADSGKLRSGIGAGYAVNQPGLSELPTDEDGNPQEIDTRLLPRPPGAGLRPSTVEGLQKLAEVQKPVEDDKALEDINKEIDDIDDEYVTDEFGNRVRSLLANKERKKAIEDRCLPMDIDDLLMKGSVEQRVPIYPAKFEPTFRSTQGHEDDFLNEEMYKVKGSERKILDSYALYRLTCGLVKINGRTLPSHIGQDGKVTQELFLAKFARVTALATPVLADLSVNYNWFVRRVEKLLVFENIKGF